MPVATQRTVVAHATAKGVSRPVASVAKEDGGLHESPPLSDLETTG
jgi:hypothetical protein